MALERATPERGMYLFEVGALLMGLVMALIFASVATERSDRLADSGAALALGSIISQARGVQRANRKHILNAERILTHKNPLDFSVAAGRIEAATIWTAVIGAALILLSLLLS